jgi:hypothetical protein
MKESGEDKEGRRKGGSEGECVMKVEMEGRKEGEKNDEMKNDK